MKQAVRDAKHKSNLGIAVAMASQMKLLAPVDEGQLRNSLCAASLTRVELLNDGPGEQGEPLDASGLEPGEALVGTNSDHAIFQEYGTIKMVAKPFLRPTVELIIAKKTPRQIFKRFGDEEMEKQLKIRKEERIKGAS
jgi:HK97 gp10 family phage protein